MADEQMSEAAEPHTFKKAERLTSEKITDELFNKGSSFVLYPFRVGYLLHEQEVPSNVQVLISAPKKKISSAVKRNRIKRLMREAYRKNKSLLYDAMSGKKNNLAISIVFMDKEVPEYVPTETKMIEALTQLAGLLK